jgi:hypothetical protein
MSTHKSTILLCEGLRKKAEQEGERLLQQARGEAELLIQGAETWVNQIQGQVEELEAVKTKLQDNVDFLDKEYEQRNARYKGLLQELRELAKVESLEARSQREEEETKTGLRSELRNTHKEEEAPPMKLVTQSKSLGAESQWDDSERGEEVTWDGEVHDEPIEVAPLSDANNKAGLEELGAQDPEESHSILKNRIVRIIGSVAAAVLLLLTGSMFFNLKDEFSQTSFASLSQGRDALLSKREKASYYPKMDSKYKGSYTDNWISTENYLYSVTNSDYREKWSEKLSIYLEKELKLPSSTIEDFLQKEADLYNNFKKIDMGITSKETLDAGLDEMRRREKEAYKEFKEILKGEKKYKQVMSFHEKFFKSNKLEPQSSANSSPNDRPKASKK